jgi:hypothetical protein
MCLSNHAGIRADHIAATTLAELVHHPDTDPEQLLAHEAGIHPRPLRTEGTNGHDADQQAEAAHTPLGVFACDEVPGTVRLTRDDQTLYLWRRGTHDRLTPTGPGAYTADGYTLTLRPSTAIRDRIDGFVLDLNRAPGLCYRLL